MTPEEKEISRFDGFVFLNDKQSDLICTLRDKFKSLAIDVLRSVPCSADRSAGIRYLRLAHMQINEAICHDWPDDK